MGHNHRILPIHRWELGTVFGLVGSGIVPAHSNRRTYGLGLAGAAFLFGRPHSPWQASYDGLAGQEANLKCVSKRIIRSTQMKHPRHLERATAARGALQIGELIADLDRIVHMLNSDIAAEEERAQEFDRCHPQYPILSRIPPPPPDNL